MKKYSLKEYLTFSKKDRIALVVLFFIVATFTAISFFYPHSKRIAPEKSATHVTTHDSSSGVMKDVVMFKFDPNTLDAEGWKSLGIPVRTANMIINYRNKGGMFRTPESLRKIYGLSPADADRLIPYIEIAPQYAQHNAYQFKKHMYTKSPSSYQRKSFDKIIPFDINTASPETWKSVPGIGDAIANRIVHYREKINGFKSVEQVKKVYGLPDSVFQKMKPYLHVENIPSTPPPAVIDAPKAALRQLSINTAYEKKLAAIPDIGPDIAKAIVIYRQQHGPYSSLDDLKKIVFINDEVFERIKPFLSL